MSAVVDTAQIDTVLDELIDSGFGESDRGERVSVRDYAVSRACAELLAEAAALAPAGASVEVGCASAASTLVICKGRMRAGCAGDGVHVIDPGQDLYVQGVGRRTIERAGLQDVVTLHESYDFEALPKLLGDGVRAGFVFIDGNHHFESVMLDLYYAQRLAVRGAVIALHDLWMPAVQHAASYWLANMAVEAVTIGEGGLTTSPYGGEPGGAGDAALWPAGFGENVAPFVRSTTLLLRTAGTDERAWDHFAPFA